MDYQQRYYQMTGSHWLKLRPSYLSQDWTEREINFLTISRGAPNPPTFEHISRSLSYMGVQRSATECKNKWYKLFPSNSDVNNAVQHLREMRKHWPGLYFHPEKQVSTDDDGHPKLIALHIVWPWSKDIMRTLSASIFCDATYETTVYHYKVVMFSTFDGNNQHRPLMCSFIMNSTSTQWATLFGIFHTRYGMSLISCCLSLTLFHLTYIRVSQRLCKVFVITSDKERAIQTGLRLSPMSEYSVQYFCALHAKWNVRDHKCSNGHIFGKQASEAWSRRMQFAEGPKAFEVGYDKMKSQFDDPARIEYINELYADPSKAYFKMDMRFSNAVLVDVCEILFSATTRWVAGSSRKPCSLLMAVARIAQGCRDLIIRPFLKEPEKTMAYISRKSSNYAITGMFKFLSLHLTQWSVRKMYDLLDQNWTKYDSQLVASNDTTAVIHKFV